MSKPGPKPGRTPYSAQEEDYTTTYSQEYIKCGKPGCKCENGEGHGPYWYSYHYSATSRRRIKKYLGKNKPAEAK